jgi:hypothetical protein
MLGTGFWYSSRIILWIMLIFPMVLRPDGKESPAVETEIRVVEKPSANFWDSGISGNSIALSSFSLIDLDAI